MVQASSLAKFSFPDTLKYLFLHPMSSIEPERTLQFGYPMLLTKIVLPRTAEFSHLTRDGWSAQPLSSRDRSMRTGCVTGVPALISGGPLTPAQQTR